MTDSIRTPDVTLARPASWTADALRNDTTWVLRLTTEESAGFDSALDAAKATGKHPLDMTSDDFPLPPASVAALKRGMAMTQSRFGFSLVKGFNVQRWSVEDARLAYWCIGLHLGVARTQNRSSDFMNDVRDAGGDYKVTNGRGYNTNKGLDFHVDSCDVVALLCLHDAMRGGTSLVASSLAMCEEIDRTRPDLLDALRQSFYYSYQGAQDPSLPPFYQCPIQGDTQGYFAFRTNRKNITAAQNDFSEVPLLSEAQREALDLLDQLQTNPRFCYAMQLDPGDLQLLNNYVVVHSRTDFEDWPEPQRKRHLLRLWLTIPQSQPLPPQWAEYYGDVRAGSVRGGLRGQAMTQQFLDYEARQAQRCGMLYRPFQAPTVTPRPMDAA